MVAIGQVQRCADGVVAKCSGSLKTARRYPIMCLSESRLKHHFVGLWRKAHELKLGLIDRAGPRECEWITMKVVLAHGKQRRRDSGSLRQRVPNGESIPGDNQQWPHSLFK